jgi:hypothetical protein
MPPSVRVIGRIDVAEAIRRELRSIGVDADVVTGAPMSVFSARPPDDGGADIVVATSAFDAPLWRWAKMTTPLRPMVATAAPPRERFLRGLPTRRHGPDAWVTWPATAKELQRALEQARASAGRRRRWGFPDVAAGLRWIGNLTMITWVLLLQRNDGPLVIGLVLSGLGSLLGSPFAWNTWARGIAGGLATILGLLGGAAVARW